MLRTAEVERELRAIGLLVLFRGRHTGSVYFGAERDFEAPRLRMTDSGLRVSAAAGMVGPRFGLEDWAEAVRELWRRTLEQDRNEAARHGQDPQASGGISRAHMARINRRLAEFLGIGPEGAAPVGQARGGCAGGGADDHGAALRRPPTGDPP